MFHDRKKAVATLRPALAQVDRYEASVTSRRCFLSGAGATLALAPLSARANEVIKLPYMYMYIAARMHSSRLRPRSPQHMEIGETGGTARSAQTVTRARPDLRMRAHWIHVRARESAANMR